MNRGALREALSLGENQSVEFKSGADVNAVGREVCAFLNSGGGYLILGVADQGRIVGIPKEKKIRSIEQAVAGGLTPKALVSFEEQRLQGKRVWVIEVPAGKDIPYSYSDSIFVREGDRTLRASVDTIRDMIMRRQVEPERWERRFSEADLNHDIDEDEVRAAAQVVTHAHRAGEPMVHPQSTKEFLEHLGLIRYGRLTNGGDVLFGARPATRHPQIRVRAVCFATDKSADSYKDLKTIEGPLVPILEQTFLFIQRNTPSRSQFRSARLAREQSSLYPPDAIREGLVNAFAHRDYANYRGGIGVQIYPDRLEIWNAGSFPKGITPDVLQKGHISVLRNPDIAHILYLRGLMEKLGRGSVLIREACKSHGMKPPVWQSNAQGVSLTFFAPEVPRKYPGKTPEVPREHPGSTPEVPRKYPGSTPEVPREIELLVKSLSGEMSRREIQQKMRLEDPEHFRLNYLVPALEAGVAEMTIPAKPNSRLQRYRLTAKGRALKKKATKS